MAVEVQRPGDGFIETEKTRIDIYAPDKEETITKIIQVASESGAGEYEQYLHVAFIQRVEGNWFSKPTAHPNQGKAGEETREKAVLISMTCPRNEELVKAVVAAILKVHPWEEPVIQVFPITEFSKI